MLQHAPVGSNAKCIMELAKNPQLLLFHKLNICSPMQGLAFYS
jgi:hypothetical protein